MHHRQNPSASIAISFQRGNFRVLFERIITPTLLTIKVCDIKTILSLFFSVGFLFIDFKQTKERL
jgi:hypothetical protein